MWRQQNCHKMTLFNKERYFTTVGTMLGNLQNLHHFNKMTSIVKLLQGLYTGSNVDRIHLRIFIVHKRNIKSY